MEAETKKYLLFRIGLECSKDISSFEKRVWKTLFDMYQMGIIDYAINEENELVFFLKGEMT